MIAKRQCSVFKHKELSMTHPVEVYYLVFILLQRWIFLEFITDKCIED